MKPRSTSSKVIDTAKRIAQSKLPSILYVDKRLLPTYGGIYFVGTDQEPTAYIGQTQCFKTRFIRHHRREAFERLLNENGRENVKIRYWEAPPMPKSELINFLCQLETYLIQHSKTRINCTANSLPKIPSSSTRRTNYGPIYVQLNQISEYFIEPSVDGTANCYFSVTKLHMAENAVEHRSPVFLISSGSWKDWKDASCEFEEIKLEWKQYPTLYFLEIRFRAHCIDPVGRGGREEFRLSGDKASFYKVFLNDLSGFKEFSIKYLRTGLINCSDSDFCETLLKITQEIT